ncbi:MAG: tetratricopeptide repeat protein [Bacteroidetes bacterium]|nr:tetratricopeptide repeat protein [Bacteroidota bacterium]
MHRISFLFILLFLVTSCQPSADKKLTATKGKGSEMTEAERMVLTSTYLDALKERSLGNIYESAKLLRTCLSMDPDNHAVLYDLALTYRVQGKVAEALPLAEQAADLDPSNLWYLSLLAENYMDLGQVDKAEKTYERIEVIAPDRLETFYELSMVKYGQGDLEGAIKELDKLEQKIGFTEELFQQKHLLYMEGGMITKAEEELKKALKTNPTDPLYYGMLAELYQSQGKTDLAMQNYMKILEFDPENGRVHLALYEFYDENGEKEKARESIMLGFQDELIDIDSKMGILLGFYELSETDLARREEAYELSRKLMDVYPGEAKAYAVYGDLLMRDERYEEARNAFLEAVQRDASKNIIWSQILAIDSYTQNYEHMRQDSEEALELFPASPDFYLLNGIALNQLGRHAEAVDILESGKIMVIDNDLILTDFYSNLGDAHHQLGHHSDSDKAFDKALSISPENVYVLNNYSYYLSLRKEKLDKAQTMAIQANEIMPGSASFEDTYAWVLYQMGNYTEAQQWIEKAMKNGGDNSGAVLEHYGDILYKQNKKSEALVQWKKAQAFDDASELLPQKVSTGTLVE